MEFDYQFFMGTRSQRVIRSRNSLFAKFPATHPKGNLENYMIASRNKTTKSRKTGTKSTNPRSANQGLKTSQNKNQTKSMNSRYCISMTDRLYGKIQQEAQRWDSTPTDLIRRFIRLGLLAAEYEKNPAKRLIVEDENGQRELLLM